MKYMILLAVVVALLSGCAYRPSLIEQNIDKLEYGMSIDKVEKLMGPYQYYRMETKRDDVFLYISWEVHGYFKIYNNIVLTCKFKNGKLYEYKHWLNELNK